MIKTFFFPKSDDIENTFYTITGISYMLFTILYFIHKDYALGWLSAIILAGYIILFIFTQFLPDYFFFTFSIIGLICYSIFVTLSFNNDLGTSLFTLSLIISASFSQYNKKTPTKFYLFVGTLSISVTLFDVVWTSGHGNLNTDIFGNTFQSFLFCYNIGISTLTVVLISLEAETNMKKMRRIQQLQINKLIQTANHDKLTGLPNRRKAMDLLHKLEAANNADGYEYSLSIFDIDKFKNFNDTYGHNCGDFMLTSISAFIQTLMPKNGLFARWGGEEFIIIVPDNITYLAHLIETIHRAVEKKHFAYNEMDVSITMTFGLAGSQTNRTLDKMLITADNNLFLGKERGRNQIVITDNSDA